MKWEDLTAPDFAKAVVDCGRVCVMAVGCVEKHFDHLPLGTDFLNGHKICCMAARIEPAVVFPPYYFGQIHEARCFPGTVALGSTMTLELLRAVCEEIARNGFRKIIIYNAHGGNTAMLQYLLQCTLARRRDYAIYLPGRLDEDRRKQWQAIVETPVHGHACECETSISLANHPDLVKMDAVGDRRTERLGRLKHLGPVRQLIVDSLAEYIAAVKNDRVARELLDEFYDRCDGIGK